jgi:hypothetical protein
MSDRNPWFRIAADSWSLGIEAAAVVAMRTAKIAAGGAAAEAEARRMVCEKIEAAGALQMMALTGALGWSAPAAAAKTVAFYRHKIRGNRRRLSQK